MFDEVKYIFSHLTLDTSRCLCVLVCFSDRCSSVKCIKNVTAEASTCPKLSRANIFHWLRGIIVSTALVFNKLLKGTGDEL
jgi:hypothetical protein